MTGSAHLVYGSWHVAVPRDAADVRHVLVPLHQRLVVRGLVLLPRQQGAHLGARLRLQSAGTRSAQSAASGLHPHKLYMLGTWVLWCQHRLGAVLANFFSGQVPGLLKMMLSTALQEFN